MNQAIQSLVRRYQDQQLNSEELRELDELLQTDTHAREIFIRETNLIAAIEGIADEQDLGPSVSALPIQNPDPSTRLTNQWIMVTGWLVAAVAASFLIAFFATSNRKNQSKTIATVIGVNGPLQWTGNGGQLRSDLSVGMKLPGGTIDGVSPDSWFSLQFDDGSVVVTSGNSMLAFSDLGQKVLHLKSGRLSADVRPQPNGSPMLIHTRSATLEIVGTSFDIDADLAATALNVTEGKVRVKRRSDGKLVDVPAQHQVIAAADQELKVSQIPKVAHRWQSRLQNGPRRTYGRWLPGTSDQEPMLRCIPHLTEKNKTIYTASFAVTVPDAAPVMTNTGTMINVKGHLDRATDLYVGMTLKTAKGDFAGRFQVVLPSGDFQPDTTFNHFLEIENFTLDPPLSAMKDDLASSANELMVESIWCHTLYQQAGLALTSVEIKDKSE
ncbi:MAG: FecR domain-containing protein [Planctomycetaceae bacterium]|nr:FecR domain-containing protein [Planctomycetaceae bacterium]